MNALYLISDQLLAWSVYFDKQVHCRVKRASREAHQAASISAQHSARLTHRTLQTLRHPNCHCAQGRGHGPKYYLSVSFPGQRPQMDYIPADIHEQTSAALADFQRVREILEEICEINRELLRRRETL